jgi:transposase
LQLKARDLGVVGIDVSKATLVVSSYGSGAGARAGQTVKQDPAARSELVQALARDGVTLVAMESTGGYERRLLQELYDAKIVVALVAPEQVKAFARSQGRRAKTDAIDCEMIAGFASVTELKPWQPPSAAMEAATALGRRRDALIKDRTREKNRLDTAMVESARDSMQRHIDYLNREARGLEKQMLAEIKSELGNQARFELLKSVPGIGNLTAARLVAELPEIGVIGHRKLSSLTGVAPMNKDSGEVEGKRKCAPGRRRVRTALFQAAHSAVLFNPVIRAFYARLMVKGKERKVALIACAHKLLIILDAMIRHGEHWDASRHPACLVALSGTEEADIQADLAELEVEPAADASESDAVPAGTKAKARARKPSKAGTKTSEVRPKAAKKTAKPTARSVKRRLETVPT